MRGLWALVAWPNLSVAGFNLLGRTVARNARNALSYWRRNWRLMFLSLLYSGCTTKKSTCCPKRLNLLEERIAAAHWSRGYCPQRHGAMVTASVAAIPTTPNFDGAQVRTFCSSPPKNALLLSLLFFHAKITIQKKCWVHKSRKERWTGRVGWP